MEYLFDAQKCLQLRIIGYGVLAPAINNSIKNTVTETTGWDCNVLLLTMMSSFQRDLLVLAERQLDPFAYFMASTRSDLILTRLTIETVNGSSSDSMRCDIILNAYYGRDKKCRIKILQSAKLVIDDGGVKCIVEIEYDSVSEGISRTILKSVTIE